MKCKADWSITIRFEMNVLSESLMHLALRLIFHCKSRHNEIPRVHKKKEGVLNEKR